MRAPGDAGSHRELRNTLLRWFDQAKRDLPWRNTSDPYAIWLSEVMLQQTQVSVATPYWERFLKQLPTVESLASAPLTEVLSLWKGLGYYSRARNLHRAAQEVVARHEGRLPADTEALRALPGFGRYTAGAVASIAFGLSAPLVDGNVARVFSRLFAVDGAPGDKAREARMWELAETLVPGERPGDWNQALMELGATVCRPEAPTCLRCPVREHCQALAQGRVAELPPPKVRKAPTQLTLALAVWWKRGRLLVARRPERGLFGGLWELPSATLPPEGEPQDALSEALGVRLTVGAQVAELQRTLTHRALTLRLFPVTRGGTLRVESKDFAETRWCTPEEARELGTSTAMSKALEVALERGPAR